MRNHSTRLVIALLMVLACAGLAGAQQQFQKPPQIGYVYPAGGQLGTTVEFIIGGQALRGASKVLIDGADIEAKVIHYYRPVRQIQPEQRRELMQKMREVREKRIAEENAKNPNFRSPRRPLAQATPQPDANAEPVALPDHPSLRELEEKSLAELRHIMTVLFPDRAKQQPNMQIAEMVLVQVSIGPNALPGDHELRLIAANGLSNPMVFQVGQLPEAYELEPNDPDTGVANLPLPAMLTAKEPVFALPVTLNGQIMPGDVDRFRIVAKKGQQLVMRVQARNLIPYLADAVPGWFQPALTLYDSKGREIAFADDYRFDPDPVLFYRIPDDGEYVVEIRDAIYRGREDFIYRVCVGELPFVTQIFPLGGPVGGKVEAIMAGWNLNSTRLELDTRPAPSNLRVTRPVQGNLFTNKIAYALDTLPEGLETEPNDSQTRAHRLQFPTIVNGRIGVPGDADFFRFEGKAGEEIVAEVMARRLNSPLDSLIRLLDDKGKVVEWNDDLLVKEEGFLFPLTNLQPHQADSYLRVTLPANGAYYLQVCDATSQGGGAWSYRLRLDRPRPDYELRVTPSSVNALSGGSTPITIHALRKDGFEGDIDLRLTGAPEGFILNGARIPAGRSSISMTLTVPRKVLKEPIPLKIEGTALIQGKTVVRRAHPAEDQMQAFLYRHLTPVRELVVFVPRQGPRMPEVRFAGDILIPEGGATSVKLNMPGFTQLADLQLSLRNAPEGLSIGDVSVIPNGLKIQIKTEPNKLKAGRADNLIVEVSMEMPAREVDGRKIPARKSSLGVLPAMPYRVVEQ